MMSMIRNYIRYNNGLLGASKRLFGAVSTLLKTEGIIGLARQWKETRLRMKQMERETQRAQATKAYQVHRTIRILATRHTAYCAYMLDAQFSRFGISSDIIIDLKHKPDQGILYVVICPQMFANVPRHMIAFQMEQSTSDRWFDAKYLNRLANSIAVLDYSTANIQYLQTKGIPSSLLYYYRVQPHSGFRERLKQLGVHISEQGESTYDAVFYGDVRCERRRKILAELSKRFRVLVVSEVFGEELYSALLSAKVVLNIHYYTPSLLETTRISECVSLGIPVISERGIFSDVHDDCNGWVRYVSVGDVEAMATEIERFKNLPRPFDAPYQASQSVMQASDFSTARLLIACGLVAPAELTSMAPLITMDAHMPICLSLPETPQRRAYAEQSCIHKPHFFDGLRHVQGWKGCALSYWYLCSVAAREHLQWLEVYEDDCQFRPDSAHALDIAKEYLRTSKGEWDVFSALVTTLPAQIQVTKVADFRGIKFVHLNKTMGMVYSIFNSSVYDHLAAWDFSNDSARNNTIDRHLTSKKNLRVITCLPYLVGHHEDVESSLWGFGNQAYNSLIETSHQQLERLVKDFELANRPK